MFWQKLTVPLIRGIGIKTQKNNQSHEKSFMDARRTPVLNIRKL